MIKVILLLANLETKVKKETKDKGNNKPNSQIVERQYKQLIADTEPYRRALPERPPSGKRVRAAVKNVRNIARNAYDNTIGNIAGYRLNRQSEKYYRKNPESKDSAAHLIPGVAQTRAGQVRLAKQLKKAGYQPYLHKADHSLSEERGAEQGFKQMKRLNRYRKVPDRKDIVIGHSSGGNRAIYMAGDERIKKYGIKRIYAIAPTPGGVKPKTLGQKILINLIAKKEDVRYDEGKKTALNLSSRRPHVPVDIIVGEHDELVPPKDAAYKHAENYYVIEGPDSTHFATSGGHRGINDLLIDLIKNPTKPKYKRYKRKGEVLEKQEGQNKRYYKMAA